MSAGRYDIKKLDRAASFSMKMTLKHDGVPMILDGYTVMAAIKEHYDDTEPYLEFTSEITDPAHGEIAISLTPEQTLTLIEHEYVYDVILINGDYITRVIDGKVYVSPDVTQVGGD